MTAPVITAPPVATPVGALVGRERDVLWLTAEARRRVRCRVRTEAGRELALALPTGSTLEPGAVLHLDRTWYVVVEAAPEPVLAIDPRSAAEALRVAFEVGNRHFALALDKERLLVPDDPAMAQLLDRLGVAWQRTTAAFHPIGRGHRHANG